MLESFFLKDFMLSFFVPPDHYSSELWLDVSNIPLLLSAVLQTIGRQKKTVQFLIIHQKDKNCQNDTKKKEKGSKETD